jgi:hypothetical protein
MLFIKILFVLRITKNQYVQNTVLLIVKATGICGYHSALKC